MHTGWIIRLPLSEDVCYIELKIVENLFLNTYARHTDSQMQPVDGHIEQII